MFWNECKQLYAEGYLNYFTDLWNIVDVVMIALYTAAYAVWILTEIKFKTYIRYKNLTNSSIRNEAFDFLYGKYIVSV